MTALNIKEIIEKIKDFYRKNQKMIKMAAVPFMVLAAVLLFWICGGDEDVSEEDISIVNQDNINEKQLDSSQNIVESGFVDISGAVVNPGVYEVNADTRIFQVVEMAGGLTENAYIDTLNQAEKVFDGQKIIVPKKNDIDLQNAEATPDNSDIIYPQGNDRVNINYADSQLLQTIPGIGPSKASKIINYRKNQGYFKSIEEIKNVTGIGDKTFEDIKEFITV